MTAKPAVKKTRKRRRPRRGLGVALRRWTRPARDMLLVPILEGLRHLCILAPEPVLLLKARFLAQLAMLCCGGMRRRAIQNLRQAGLASSDKGACRLAGEMFFQLILGTFEWMKSTAWDEAEFRRRITIDALELHAQWREQSLIIFTGHVGNWELMPRAHIAWGGTAGTIAMTGQRNAALNAWIARTREIGGNRLVFEREAMLGLVRTLRRGKPIALLSDQDSNRWPGVFVPFFGRPAWTPEGPARLALRCGAPLMIMTMERSATDPWRHTLHVEEPIWPDPANEPEAEIQRLTALCTARLEACIRRAPAQWVWLHDRWHHQPGRKIKRRK